MTIKNEDVGSMNDAISIMTHEIVSLLSGRVHSVWLYGSAVLDDFKLGWSDIDFIAFSDHGPTDREAERLVTLRQSLSTRFPDTPYFALFEGVIMPFCDYSSAAASKIVYWGTSGQRIIERYKPDSFARYELFHFGKSLYGCDDRAIFAPPSKAELVADTRRHYNGIRDFALHTDASLYSCGWLLDISRCIYTLRTGGVIGKTQAGEWALNERIFSFDEPLKKALEIRRSPLEYKHDAETQAWLAGLGPAVQTYADVLERELAKCV